MFSVVFFACILPAFTALHVFLARAGVAVQLPAPAPAPAPARIMTAYGVSVPAPLETAVSTVNAELQRARWGL